MLLALKNVASSKLNRLHNIRKVAIEGNKILCAFYYLSIRYKSAGEVSQIPDGDHPCVGHGRDRTGEQ